MSITTIIIFMAAVVLVPGALMIALASPLRRSDSPATGDTPEPLRRGPRARYPLS